MVTLRWVAILIAAAMLVACGNTSSARPDKKTSPTPKAASMKILPPSSGLYWGAWVPGLENHETLSKFEAAVGNKTPSLLTIYWSWADESDFPTTDASWISSQGIVPLLMWESWDWKVGNPNQSKYKLAAIASGDFDVYLTRFAQQVKGYNRPILIAPFHEMNGDWYPWGGTVNGNSPQDLIRAWKHVVDLFRQAGANNVTWTFVWNRDSVPAGQTVQNYWPGDNYVDWVGLDAYTWGTPDRGGWQDARATLEPGLEVLRELHKPILITETSSAEKGGNKAQWITGLFKYLAQAGVAGFIWFDERSDEGFDFQIDSSTESLQAFQAGLNQASLAAIQTG